MTGFRLPASWPLPADRAAASLLHDELAETLDLDGNTRDEARSARCNLIACLGGNSRYLSDLARREHALLTRLVRQGPNRVLPAVLRRLRGLHPDTPRADIASALRQAKRQVALVTAIADLGGLWSLAQVTGALSLLAEAALRVSVSHLLSEAHRSGQIRLADPKRPERGSGLIVLGMGKLGARELNYSSDIDLVLLFDPAMHAGIADPGRSFARIATGLVSLMEARDQDGYVFRTDLRLRPDPGTTPPAVSLPAAITYYESYGQTWERAAMTKARPVAGDLEAGERFLETIRPFIWRRHLDFAAIEDIHAMKRRIDRNKPAPARTFDAQLPDDPVGALLGHDVKLGHGGIREIEFIAQTLQLVWAGRAPDLRDPTTLGALSKLAGAAHLRRDTAASLSATYARLRGIEHRLQMQDDRQTHELPRSRERFEDFAVFMGAANGDQLARSLLPELRRTRRRFEAMVRSPIGRQDLPFGETVLSDRFELDADDAQAKLEALGFPAGPRALEILRAWQTDRYRALREPRARTLLDRLTPSLLAALGTQRDPLAVLVRFDALLSRQTAGVQLLSLFERQPSLLERIAAILGASPALGDHLAAVPEALDGLLEAEAHGPANRAVLRNLDRQMRGASGIEEAIRIARHLVRGEEFRLSVAQLDGALGVDAAGTARTALAEHVIVHMMRQVQSDHRRRYGIVPGGAMSVVALGKAGSREMMAGSDLDLMLIYDHPETVAESVQAGASDRDRSARSVPPSVYFTRLAHALIAALSAPGVEGPLYALDMRLRPSGSKGPVAVSLAAFRRYHRETSWTWERMALSRARVVAGPAGLRRTVKAAIDAALTLGPTNTPRSLREDAASMRARVARDLPPRGPWDVKLRDGGLLEVEFIAQLLQLASADASVRHPTTRIALRRLARAGLLAPAEARRLIAADRFWRALQSQLRILLGTATPPSLARALPPASIEALLSGLGGDAARADGLDGLAASCDAMAHRVRASFERLIGPLPARLPAPAPGVTGTPIPDQESAS